LVRPRRTSLKVKPAWYVGGNSRKKGYGQSGFTFYRFVRFRDKGRKEYFRIAAKTDCKKFSEKIKEMNTCLKEVCNTGKPEAW